MDASPPALVEPAPLDALVDDGELRYLPPDGHARLVRLAPFPSDPPARPAIVFIHGVGGDPANQWRLIREAQARGMRAWAMAYETWSHGVAENADGFAAALRELAASGEDDVTIVAHSLGALTAKGALDRLRRPDGHLEGFRRLRFVALGAPWAGVSGADLARYALTEVRPLAYARDLAPGSAYWRGIMAAPLAPEVRFESLGGTWDAFELFTWNWPGHPRADALLAQAARTARLPGATHNAPNWDRRAAAFVFGGDATGPAPDPCRTALRELAATLGVQAAFRDPD